MEERMDAIGEIIMEAGYPTVLCFQVTLMGSTPQAQHQAAGLPVSFPG